MKRKTLFISLIFLLVTACGGNDDQQQGQQKNQQNNNGQVEVQENKGNGKQGKQNQANDDRTDEKHKTLAGGSERKRNPNLTKISALQQRFPGILVLRGARDSNQVALTFDDGPDPRYTPQILDVLKTYDVKATFFLLGSRAKAYPNIVRRIKREGHIIANHTYWHPNLAKEKPERMDWEIKQTEETLRKIAGETPRLFRPPYGELNADLVQRLGNLGYSVVGWSSDSLNWKQLPAETIKENVLSNVQPGDIILFHDAGNWNMDLSGTIKALQMIIPQMQEQGIEFTTVPDMLGIAAYR